MGRNCLFACSCHTATSPRHGLKAYNKPTGVCKVSSLGLSAGAALLAAHTSRAVLSRWQAGSPSVGVHCFVTDLSEVRQRLASSVISSLACLLLSQHAGCLLPAVASLPVLPSPYLRAQCQAAGSWGFATPAGETVTTKPIYSASSMRTHLPRPVNESALKE